ncbi:putative ABC transporter G family member 11 isoform X2 [Iris pallida]|uniref:ABC transporter G family member 11 isoform X2 n=1 Tax=Iris pallida TaxID=29817 RepID=A0AAX6H3U2_IRIPA|nr:putative ABC transporter G family member 11 isoform X2 [Iris pallida]
MATARSSAAGQVMVEIEANKPAGSGLAGVGLESAERDPVEGEASMEFIGDVSARLTWKDLTVMVTLGSGETQTVLEGLTGYAERHADRAHGPSGSGKSTMLDALSSRLATNASSPGPYCSTGGRLSSPSAPRSVFTKSYHFCGLLHKNIYTHKKDVWLPQTCTSHRRTSPLPHPTSLLSVLWSPRPPPSACMNTGRVLREPYTAMEHKLDWSELSPDLKKSLLEKIHSDMWLHPASALSSR